MRRLLLSAMLGALIALAGVSFWNRPLNFAPQPAAAGLPLDVAAASSSSSVRVEHAFVTVTPRVEAAARPSATRAPRPVTGRASAPKTGFFARARRVLVGSGQHRPQPFPRAQ